MKKLLILLVMATMLLLMGGCGDEETTEIPNISTPVGEVQAVVPEEGDISIEITP